jgi:hypothetical protein
MHSFHRSIDAGTWLVEHDPLPIGEWRESESRLCGFDARSDYVETYWLAVLGPSSVLAIRRLSWWLEAEPNGFGMSIAAFGRTLGLGPGTGRHAPVIRTLARLIDFGVARICDTYQVRRVLPRLTTRQIARLPDHLAAAHAADITIEAT